MKNIVQLGWGLVEALSQKNVEEVRDLVGRVFYYDRECANMQINAALAHQLCRDDVVNDVIVSSRYCVVRDGVKKRVVGVVSVDELSEDMEEANWLGWFCVSPEFRGVGLGRWLLTSAVEHTLVEGKKFLRLYTTTHPIESMAQRIYEDMGFDRVYSKMQAGHSGGCVMFRELRLPEKSHFGGCASSAAYQTPVDAGAGLIGA